ncbi:MAG: MerR family DNA-binding transcriptional regulator [Candidatus Komeilibacteria bacterium]|nr:MerR family DNA-binding transcriptional regulator [Candidatus Komeilibacteria bacterium]
MQKRIKDTGLVKIGELAKMFSVLPSTINFYTREGLIKEAGRSQGGYRLYDASKAMRVLKKIVDMQIKKRYTIEEIKSRL